MRSLRSACLSLVLLVLCSFYWSPPPAAAAIDEPYAGDALYPPPRRSAPASADNPSPSSAQPSAFLAGRVVVQVIFVESNGAAEPSSEDWTPDQITAVESHIAAALEWWRGRVPNARLSFSMPARVVESGYEPIRHDLGTEGLWIGDVLGRLGYAGASYFDRAYTADDALRRADHADWATTIFVANSAADPDGRFADNYFAYAYIGGPFMVITSDAGGYGMDKLAPVVAHEFGHLFGALDQYAAAGTPCTWRSGYLDVATSNSQANHCGTNFSSIMLEPLSAYACRCVDDSALGQVGYRDEDGDGLPDPLDTAPVLQVTLAEPPSGARPHLAGRAVDQPHPTVLAEPASINPIVRVEYRIDGGVWTALPAADGAYDSVAEDIDAILPLYDGQHAVELRAVNRVGAASAVVSEPVTVRGVGAAPPYQVDAPAFSNTADIGVRLSAPEGADQQISNDPFFTGVAWSPVAASVTWRLGPADGAQTFYVRFRDSAGLESPPIVRSVMLDREPPSGQAIILAGSTPLLELQAYDHGSGVVAVQFGDDANAPGIWQPFQPALALPPGTTSIWARLRDAAGNTSAPLLARSTYLVYLPLARA